MKRFVALLLILCLAIGLVACTKPTTDPKDTTASSNNSKDPTNNNSGDATDPTGNEGNTGNEGTVTGEEPNSNDAYINPEAFSGKKLQIWGYSSQNYADPENPVYSYWGMIRAAADEWAALNQVEIEFVADYNETQILAAINNGDKPDLLLSCNFFPTIAVQGIVRAFTEEEYKTLSGIVPASYLDAITYKGQTYGFQQPWAGNDMFVYNRTMFENYDVKTPKEYYMEDNWTWDTMVQCWEDITKDLDGDGKMDTYGIGCYNQIFESFPIEEDEDGKIHSTVLSDKYRKQREILYKGIYETGSIKNNNAFCTLAKNPRPGTMNGVVALFDFGSIYRELMNGDILETVPMPAYDANDPHNSYHLNIMSIFNTCDESEAAFALLCYMTKVTMRWMSDYSLGIYKCEFEGLRGASDLSKAVVEAGEELLVERREGFEELEDWDQEFYDKMMADINSRRATYYRYYTGKSAVIPADVDKLPPASALPQINVIYEAYCEQYNTLYAN